MQNRRFITGWVLVIWGIIGFFPIAKEIRTQIFEFNFYNIIEIIIWLIIYLTGYNLIRKSLNEK